MDERNPEKAVRKLRTVTLHFEETCSYAVPVQTSLTDDELKALYDGDDGAWMRLVDTHDQDLKEPEERWEIACCTAVLGRVREAIFDEEGHGI